jgi:hypothetical protein
MVVEINDSLVDGNQVDTVPVSHPSSPASTVAPAVTAGEVQAKRQIHSTRARGQNHADARTVMVKVCEWSERIEAQTSATVERDVGAWKQCVVYCEDTLRWKVRALTEVEKEQSRIQRAVEERDAELAKVRAELKPERKALTDVERLRGQLTEAQADVKLLKWRLGMTKMGAEKAGMETRKISDAFHILQEEQKKRSTE